MIATIKKLTGGHFGLTGRLLDVGAGYGFFTREAVINLFNVVAINPAEDERHIGHSVSGIESIRTTFEELELEPASVSVVLMSQVLEHALDVDLWVSKAWQLLEPNGIVAIALPNFGSLQRLILQENEPYICPPAHLNFFTPEALASLLRNRGFAIEEIQHVSRVPKSTIGRRVRGTAAFLAAPLWLLTTQFLQIVDVMRLGSIINVYARKPQG